MGPEELARFRLRKVLGRGGRPGLFGGDVWEADDEDLGVRVVVKILRVDDETLFEMQARFLEEAQLLVGVRHPHLAHVRGASGAAAVSFVVMDLVEGRPLGSLGSDEAVSRWDKIRWMREVALGLSAMHDLELAHRDVKPENVIVRADGSACLVDLGVPFDEGSGPDDALDDQAAWAEMGQELLGPDASALVGVLDRAGAPDRHSRYPSMHEVVSALDNACRAGGNATESDAGGRPRGAARRTLHPAVAVLALAVLIALSVLLQRLLLD